MNDKSRMTVGMLDSSISFIIDVAILFFVRVLFLTGVYKFSIAPRMNQIKQEIAIKYASVLSKAKPDLMWSDFRQAIKDDLSSRIVFVILIFILIGVLYDMLFHLSKKKATIGEQVVGIKISVIRAKPPANVIIIIHSIFGSLYWFLMLMLYQAYSMHSIVRLFIFGIIWLFWFDVHKIIGGARRSIPDMICGTIMIYKDNKKIKNFSLLSLVFKMMRRKSKKKK